MAIYKIKNDGSRGQAFRATGGLEVVAAGEEKTLDLSEELTPERIEQFKEIAVLITEGSGSTDNAPTVSLSRPEAAPVAKQAEQPAETGGVVAQSAVSEKGGVARAPTDTTTTTKQTTEHKGAKA